MKPVPIPIPQSQSGSGSTEGSAGSAAPETTETDRNRNRNKNNNEVNAVGGMGSNMGSNIPIEKQALSLPLSSGKLGQIICVKAGLAPSILPWHGLHLGGEEKAKNKEIQAFTAIHRVHAHTYTTRAALAASQNIHSSFPAPPEENQHQQARFGAQGCVQKEEDALITVYVMEPAQVEKNRSEDANVDNNNNNNNRGAMGNNKGKAGDKDKDKELQLRAVGSLLCPHSWGVVEAGGVMVLDSRTLQPPGIDLVDFVDVDSDLVHSSGSGQVSLSLEEFIGV
jgi:hypothetical protein